MLVVLHDTYLIFIIFSLQIEMSVIQLVMDAMSMLAAPILMVVMSANVILDLLEMEHIALVFIAIYFFP